MLGEPELLVLDEAWTARRGLLLGAAGAVFEVAASSAPSGPHAPTGAIVADGLVAVLVEVCVLFVLTAAAAVRSERW